MVRLHMATKYEIPVAFSITRASRAETKELDGDKLETPLLRCKDFSADRGLDSGPLKAKLWDRYGIRPLIDTRLMWREEKNDTTRTNPSSDRSSTTTSTIRREARCCADVLKPASNGTFQGFEADRGACGTLKYRCPAAAFGMRRAQGMLPSASGWRAVRVDLEKHDRRLFTPTPWGSPSWKRGPSFRPGADL